LALLQGALFGGAKTVYYSFFFKNSNVLIVCGIGGAGFGLFASGMVRWKARDLGLPSWRNYGKSN
jgi:hypothetical protein